MLATKLKTLLNVGLDPFRIGKHNFEFSVDEIEALAKERALKCMGCRYFKKEPVDFLRVEDKRIPELSEMSCGKCGCLLPYKARQSIKPCSKWLK